MTLNISVMSEEPIVQNPYSIPIPTQKSVKRIIVELLKFNRPLKSVYPALIVLVKKQNGEDRLCVNHPELNTMTEKQSWLIPSVVQL